MRQKTGPKPKDHTGKVFGRWTVIDRSAKQTSGYKRYWSCVCSCGTKRDVPGAELATGRSNSCGCIQREKIFKHGKSKSKAFGVWTGMKRRCDDASRYEFRSYGAKGVTYCERWQSFSNFYADMGDPPTGLTLDRIDPYGNYEPGNCKWSTLYEQSKNKRKRIAETE
jgi:hypothetical protein